MRFAVRRTLLSSSSPYIAFGIIFLAGAGIFTAGSLMLRSAERGPSLGITWTRSVIGDDKMLDVASRVEIVERLELIGQAWCADALEAALGEEHDVRVRTAVERALRAVRENATASYENI